MNYRVDILRETCPSIWLGQPRNEFVPLLTQAVVQPKPDSEDEYSTNRYYSLSDIEALIFAKIRAKINEKIHIYTPIITEDGMFLPTLDVDHGDVERIKQRCIDIPRLIIQSSDVPSFWVILDIPQPSVKDALLKTSASAQMYSDRRYIDCAIRTNIFVLRAVPKMGVIPTVIENTLINPKSKEWADSFISHWNRPEIQEIAEIQTSFLP